MLKRLISALLFVSVLIGFTQDVEAQFVVREDVHVAPGAAAEYEALSKSRVGRMGAGNVAFERRAAVSTGDGHYRYVTLLDPEFSSVTEWRAQIAAMPASNTPGAAAGVIESIDRAVWQGRPDLSYTPDQSRITTAEVGFVREVLLYPKFGSQPAVEDILLEIKQLYERYNSGERRLVRELVLGSESPAISIVFLARNPQDFAEESTRNRAMLGDELQELVNRNNRLMRELQFEDYLARPDLGYQRAN